MMLTEEQIDRIRQHCRNAIGTMRGFLDDAERLVERPIAQTAVGGPEDLPAEVLHALGWGLANAGSSLQRAIRELRHEETGR